jgi:hypothetical protein
MQNIQPVLCIGPKEPAMFAVIIVLFIKFHKIGGEEVKENNTQIINGKDTQHSPYIEISQVMIFVTSSQKNIGDEEA